MIVVVVHRTNISLGSVLDRSSNAPQSIRLGLNFVKDTQTRNTILPRPTLLDPTPRAIIDQPVRTCMAPQGSTNQMATIGTTPFIVPYFSMFSTRLLSPSITRNTFLAHPRPFPLQYH